MVLMNKKKKKNKEHIEIVLEDGMTQNQEIVQEIGMTQTGHIEIDQEMVLNQGRKKNM